MNELHSRPGARLRSCQILACTCRNMPERERGQLHCAISNRSLKDWGPFWRPLLRRARDDDDNTKFQIARALKIYVLCD
jgi:hypothetical protein